MGGGLNTGDTIITGVTGSVRGIYARDTANVYIGGLFTNVNSNTNMAYIAKYNGTGISYSQVGSTVLNGNVIAMSDLDPSNVYVGGSFTNASIGVRISSLNTYSNAFTPLTSGGLNDTVRTIYALDPSNVYIGGNFTNGGTIGNYVTRWDGSQFNKLGDSDLSGGLINAIYALDSSHVYIGGTFTRYGNNNNMKNIAMWNGTNMTALNTGIPTETDVRAIYALDEYHVYIGGSFDHVKMWNGSTYTTLSSILALSSVQSLKRVKNDKSTLYVAGGGASLSGIQKRIT